MPMTWEITEQQKLNAALDREERIFGVIFEPWELRWLERSGIDINKWIASAIDHRFAMHGQNFLRDDIPPRCDLCLEEWGAHNRSAKPYLYDITGGVGVKTWAISHRLYLHAECASQVISAFDPNKVSPDQIAYKTEIADLVMTNLAQRLHIHQ